MADDADDDDRLGEAFPLPPPEIPFHGPIPPPDHDVVWVARRRPEPDRPDREHEDIMLRRVPRPVAQRFRAAAGGRGLTHAQYLAALVGHHDAMRRRADG